MDRASVLKLIEEGGISYAEARPQIKPGNLLLLHHDYLQSWAELSWYDKQISLVQQFTGPFAHVAILDRIRTGEGDSAEETVVAYESVVPRRRAVRVSTTAEHGFFMLSMNRPISTTERQAIWSDIGFGEYSKWGALMAGAGCLPANEDKNPRMWCAKAVALWRRISGVDLGSKYVPTDMALTAMNQGARIQFVQM